MIKKMTDNCGDEYSVEIFDDTINVVFDCEIMEFDSAKLQEFIDILNEAKKELKKMTKEPNLSYWLIKRRPKTRHFDTLINKVDRYNYLLKGEVYGIEWMNGDTMEKFYRPELNGIPVIDRDNTRFEFKTAKEAKEEGLRIRGMIEDVLKELNND